MASETAAGPPLSVLIAESHADGAEPPFVVGATMEVGVVVREVRPDLDQQRGEQRRSEDQRAEHTAFRVRRRAAGGQRVMLSVRSFLRAGALLLLAVVLQVSAFSQIGIVGGRADLVVLAVAAIVVQLSAGRPRYTSGPPAFFSADDGVSGAEHMLGQL